MKAVNELEGVKKPDLLFHNNGGLRFTNASQAWGMTQEAYGNGAAYADLDNDGDLDLVINNINDKAFIYQNHTVETGHDDAHYLRIALQGAEGNRNGIGARITLHYKNGQQVREYTPQRGYQSTVEPCLHFGLGKVAVVDTLRVQWPGGREQVLTNVSANRLLTLREHDAMPAAATPETRQATVFNEVSAQTGLQYRHSEDEYIDFKATPTLPLKHSQSGPAVAIGDINNDGIDDVILCGAARRAARIFIQKTDGTFTTDSLPAKGHEDAGLLLFDADGDGDNDLYCASGSSEFTTEHAFYQDRFYRNTGGKLIPDATALPAETSSGSCVTACDFDNDGDLDLFVGGRIVPRRYPEAPESLVLQNNGRGIFTNITETLAPALRHAGLVTAALWTDFDRDGWTDLAIAGEWMPVTFYKNIKGHTFTNVYAEAPGWWNSITGADFDSDGDTDYICGNVGLNSLFQASEQEPVYVYGKDFDNSGSFDPLLSRYVQGKEYLAHPRETLTDQIVSFKRKLTRYSIYGKATRAELLPPQQLEGALVRKATQLASVYIENKGNGHFATSALPIEAQTAPLNGIQVTDINGDGHLDLLGIGNNYAAEPLAGRYDAGIGICLLGNGGGSFKAMPVTQSGFFVNTDAKSLVQLQRADNTPLWLATANQDSLRVFKQHTAQLPWITPGPLDVFAMLEYTSGKRQRLELYYGSGYLSASTRRFTVPSGVQTVWITNSRGVAREVWSKTLAAAH